MTNEMQNENSSLDGILKLGDLMNADIKVARFYMNTMYPTGPKRETRFSFLLTNLKFVTTRLQNYAKKYESSEIVNYKFEEFKQIAQKKLPKTAYLYLFSQDS